MSHNKSSCIPPPSDYTPKVRPPNTSKYHDRGGRSGGRGYRGSQRGRPTTTHRDRHDDDFDKTKIQPKDRFHRNEDDDYFADVQDEEEDKEAEGSQNANDDDDEDDPLDAYMKSLEDDQVDSVNKSQSTSRNESLKDNSEEPEVSTSSAQDSDGRGVRLDIENKDEIEELYYRVVDQRHKRPSEQESEDSDQKQDLVEYDNDGNVLGVRKIKREIDPLPPLDHSTITYETFEKNFYNEHSEIQQLSQEQSEELRSKLEIKVNGNSPPKPVCSFAHFKFDEQLMKVIRRSEYTQPTPIQAQAIPAALSGRNIIGIAVTGSGKTAAYLWPMIVHIMGQPDLKRGDGPIGLVLVPTRELALQVYGEAKKFSHSYKIAVVCAYGGGSKYEQSRDLEAGAEIIVATPGRLIDLIKQGSTNLRRVTYLVLDEADRFFDLGFEAQIRSICNHVRPDRQTLLFSATFKKKIEQLARTVTEDPIKIVQKNLGEANEDVTQHVIILPAGNKKWDWLISRIVEFTSAGSVLIFVTRILNCEELYNNLKNRGTEALLLHGDMEQSERNRVITLFKRKEKDILIATDVAARGLDISHIRTVINYDVARDIDTHIHRVGRTGRAGSKGDAYTLMTDRDKEFAGHLVKNLENFNQDVSNELMKLAMQSHSFRKLRAGKNHKSSRSSHHNHHRHDNRSGQRNDNYRERSNQHHTNWQHHHNNRNQDDSHRSDSGRTSYNHASTDYDQDRKRSKWH